MDLSTCLLFDGRAEEALRFYEAILPGARVDDTLRIGADGPSADGAFVAATLVFDGGRILLLNGPAAAPSIAVSLFLVYETQAEVDRLWDALSEGGAPLQCGWVTDRFGVTWQIVPRKLRSLLADPDPARAARAMRAMMDMIKLDIDKIERAAAGSDGRGGTS